MNKAKELLSISKPVEKRIDQAIHDIFSEYKDKLLLEDVSYIIPAVWGSIQDGQLDSIQEEIHDIAERLVADCLDIFGGHGLEPAQEFAIRYLVNRSLIYSVSFLVEMSQHQMSKDRIQTENILLNLPPMGTA